MDVLGGKQMKSKSQSVMLVTIAVVLGLSGPSINMPITHGVGRGIIGPMCPGTNSCVKDVLADMPRSIGPTCPPSSPGCFR